MEKTSFVLPDIMMYSAKCNISPCSHREAKWTYVGLRYQGKSAILAVVRGVWVERSRKFARTEVSIKRTNVGNVTVSYD